jgi:uncharacterized membrane protein YecN with MAPEG domain
MIRPFSPPEPAMNTAVANAFPIVGVYAALNVLILAWLGLSTGKLRRLYKVSIGDGGVPHLTRVMRGHANAIENMPMMFVMLVIAAAMGTPAGVLHTLGASFTIGRALHASYFIQPDAPMRLRVVGFGLGFLATVVLALGLVAHGIARLLWG